MVLKWMSDRNGEIAQYIIDSIYHAISDLTIYVTVNCSLSRCATAVIGG